MRKAPDFNNNNNNSPILPNRVEPDPELVNQIIEDNKKRTPSKVEESPNGCDSFPEGEHSSGHKGTDVNIESTGGQPMEIETSPFPDVVPPSPEQEIRPSPVEQPRARRNRKRKLYDESTVLTNRYSLPQDLCCLFLISICSTNSRR